eukprot:GHVQ01035365.1.p1 GENE.GHVQ01035365.1~~GHVQ01035365.1.p1  ORF type:complete len:485 (+),score=71.23 GHVQ01035365.1:91-1455(+)
MSAGTLQDEIEELLAAEKKARQAAEADPCSRLVCKILRKLQKASEWGEVRDHVTLLCKKRGQLNKCIVDAVRLCMKWVEGEVVELDKFVGVEEGGGKTEIVEMDKEEKQKLINTLIGVTQGKIFVEVEQARLTRISAKIKEADGLVEEAAQLLQEVQIETFGTMDAREKAEYIMEQMRLVLLRKDYVRCQIISRKLNAKLLEPDDMQDMKLIFYEYMCRYFVHENMLLDVCKAYYAMLHTPMVQSDCLRWTKLLRSYTVFLLLSPFDNEQRDLLLKLQSTEKERLEQSPIYKGMVDSFLKVELMPWPLSYEDELKAHEVFQDLPFPGGDDRWKLLKKRVMQHNVQVLGAYYKRISMSRMSELLGLSKEECETEICDLVCSKYLQAKMDRPAALVTFGARKDTCDHLNEWSSDISRLLDLVEESSHLIQKERMVNAARAKQAQIQVKTMPGSRAI